MREFTQDVKIFSETRSAFQPHTCLRTLMNPIIYFCTLHTFNSQSNGWTFFDSSITWVGTWLNTTNPTKSGRVNFDLGIFTQDYWIFVQNGVVILARFSCNTKIFSFLFIYLPYVYIFTGASLYSCIYKVLLHKSSIFTRISMISILPPICLVLERASFHKREACADTKCRTHTSGTRLIHHSLKQFLYMYYTKAKPWEA